MLRTILFMEHTLLELWKEERLSRGDTDFFVRMFGFVLLCYLLMVLGPNRRHDY